jgi:hypothetical protein
MIIKTGFPEYIESIAIGEDSSFLKENTDLCQIANDFSAEVNLAYLWKKIATDPDTLNATRNFTKHFLLDAPNLTTEHVLYYRNKINELPKDIRDQLNDEVEGTFDKANNLSLRVKTTPPTERNFTNSGRIDTDKDFLQKIADLMNQCDSACNYFKNLSHRVGSIYDYSAINTVYNAPPQDTDINTPPSIGGGLEKANKMPSILMDCVTEAFTSAKAFTDKAKSSLHNFVSNYNLEKLGKKAKSTDEEGAIYLGATSPSLFQETMEAYSQGVSNNRMFFGDCFRLVDYMARYNPFNPNMNITKYLDKDIGVTTLEVVDGKYVRRTIRVKPNGVTTGYYIGEGFGQPPLPGTYRKLNDEHRPKKEYRPAQKAVIEQVSDFLDKYLENSPLITNFDNLPEDQKRLAAEYGILEGSKEEWKNFFMNLAEKESNFNYDDVSTPAGSSLRGDALAAALRQADSNLSYGVFQIGTNSGRYDGLKGGDYNSNELIDIETNTKTAVKIWERNLYREGYGFIKNGNGAGFFGTFTTPDAKQQLRKKFSYQ